MNKSIPVFNRIIVERELKKKYHLHQQKIQDIQFSQPQIKSTSVQNQKRPNRKALMMEEDRKLRIEKDNLHLLSKLSKIMNKTFTPMKRTFSPLIVSDRVSEGQVSNGGRGARSLNREYRIKKLTQISEENQQFANRLVQQRGKYGEEYEHYKKYKYFLTNFTRFKPIAWEDKRSKSNQMSQVTKYTNDLANETKFELIQPSNKQNNSLLQGVEDKDVPVSKSLRRKRTINGRVYFIEIQKLHKMFEIRAQEDQSSKCYRIELNSQNAHRLFSHFHYNFDELVQKIRFHKNQMIISPQENEADSDDQKKSGISFQDQLSDSQRNKVENELIRVYNQRKELNFVEKLKPRRGKPFKYSYEEQKNQQVKQNFFTRDLYRNAKFKPLDLSLPNKEPTLSQVTSTNNKNSPKQIYMKVSEVLKTEKSNKEDMKDSLQQISNEETLYVDNMINDQLNQSNHSLEIKEIKNISKSNVQYQGSKENNDNEVPEIEVDEDLLDVEVEEDL